MNPFCTIGIDPALTHTGLCCVPKIGEPAYRLIVPPRDMRGAERLHRIAHEAAEFFGASPRPDLVVIEGYALKGQNLVQLAEVNGILQLLGYRAAGQVLLVAPTQLKKFATGNSYAGKRAIMARYHQKDEHLADARALAEIGQVYLGRTSRVRSELEVVEALKNPAKAKKVTVRSSGGLGLI